MPVKSLLVANRGGIAVRIGRAAADLGIRSIAIHSEADAASLHTRVAEEGRVLQGRDRTTYLDIAQILAVAKESGCDADHPGYSFLAERADFAAACAEADLTFVGPGIANLELFGDKGRACVTAAGIDVPALRGTNGLVCSPRHGGPQSRDLTERPYRWPKKEL
jgi:acetyl/propionyl-CoA carboxylase alpha subunit